MRRRQVGEVYISAMRTPRHAVSRNRGRRICVDAFSARIIRYRAAARPVLFREDGGFPRGGLGGNTVRVGISRPLDRHERSERKPARPMVANAVNPAAARIEQQTARQRPPAGNGVNAIPRMSTVPFAPRRGEPDIPAAGGEAPPETGWRALASGPLGGQLADATGAWRLDSQRTPVSAVRRRQPCFFPST